MSSADDLQVKPIWKGKRIKFTDSDSDSNESGSLKRPPHVLSDWVDDITKYGGRPIKTSTYTTCMGDKFYGYRDTMYTRRYSEFIPEIAVPRDHREYEVFGEVASFAISDYNKHHNQTMFQVVDLMQYRQSISRCGNDYITQHVEFTAKDIKSKPCALKTFVGKVRINLPSKFREVEDCELQVFIN